MKSHNYAKLKRLSTKTKIKTDEYLLHLQKKTFFSCNNRFEDFHMHAFSISCILKFILPKWITEVGI